MGLAQAEDSKRGTKENEYYDDDVKGREVVESRIRCQRVVEMMLVDWLIG